MGKQQTGRLAPDWLVVQNATNQAVDNYVSNVETLLIALSQRKLSDDQVERLAGILQRAEKDLLSRLAAPSTTSAARTRRKRVRAA